ncbi:hypothetical protein B0A55_03540 [Friedmanniomyces simplex]|uniref:Tyrosinase copper-binding domain-containing protein n=1 Tax=Friedmanniomyces simplex TaxID=329884 RepID=A0A4V5NGM0_9PEZI|nr:hypothetical protein B0A55_03540 [Friedmanniomyces simplex]
MRFTLISALASTTLLSSGAQAWTPAPTTLTDELEVQGLIKLAEYEAHHYPPPSCNTSTGYIRKEWHTLKDAEKTAYIDAVLCMQKLPAKSGSFAPGAKSRFDDFVAVHINQTLIIHATANFLSWHRYFTWTWEHALRNECGYTGYQPYANWAKLSADPLGSPLFDGSATSISNNGADLPNKNDTYFQSAANPQVVLPPGTGGKCVTAGPFVNMSVNLGPLVPAYSDIPPNPSPDGLGYNPRCLRRDISTYAANLALKDSDIAHLIVNRTDIASFQNDMEGLFNYNEPFLGVHTAGHFLVGGDPGGDFFASPGDPWFFLHHAQIDRTWWIWQNQDLKNRQNAIAGTITILNEPPSRNGTLQDMLNLGFLAPEITMASAMSTLGGEFCYVYV